MNKREASEWLDRVGSWPSSDPEVQQRTREAERVLKLPRVEPRPECTLWSTGFHQDDSLYPRSVYRCPEHGLFDKYVVNGAVCWSCMACGKAGNYVGYRCACGSLVNKEGA